MVFAKEKTDRLPEPPFSVCSCEADKRDAKNPQRERASTLCRAMLVHLCRPLSGGMERKQCLPVSNDKWLAVRFLGLQPWDASSYQYYKQRRATGRDPHRRIGASDDDFQDCAEGSVQQAASAQRMQPQGSRQVVVEIRCLWGMTIFAFRSATKQYFFFFGGSPAGPSRPSPAHGNSTQNMSNAPGTRQSGVPENHHADHPWPAQAPGPRPQAPGPRQPNQTLVVVMRG